MKYLKTSTKIFLILLLVWHFYFYWSLTIFVLLQTTWIFVLSISIYLIFILVSIQMLITYLLDTLDDNIGNLAVFALTATAVFSGYNLAQWHKFYAAEPKEIHATAAELSQEGHFFKLKSGTLDTARTMNRIYEFPETGKNSKNQWYPVDYYVTPVLEDGQPIAFICYNEKSAQIRDLDLKYTLFRPFDEIYIGKYIAQYQIGVEHWQQRFGTLYLDKPYMCFELLDLPKKIDEKLSILLWLYLPALGGTFLTSLYVGYYFAKRKYLEEISPVVFNSRERPRLSKLKNNK
jgi:hypothetical protein